MESITRRTARAAALAGALLMPLAAVEAAYVLTEFSKPGAVSTTLFDVNNTGQMAGYFFESVGGPSQGFIYDGTSFTTLSGPAGALSAVALGISDGGTVVGNYAESDGGPLKGFFYSGGTYGTFSIAGAQDTILRGISPDGRFVAGYFSTATVAGTGFVHDRLTGVTTTVSTPFSQLTIAQGVNNAQVLVGSDLIFDGIISTAPGFFYDIATATRTDVDIAGATRTALRAIDEAGTVAGWFRDGGGTHGFVGSIASFEQIDFVGAAQTFVEGSNDARVLVGNYNVAGADFSRAFVATPVPEPAAFGLLALGLGLLGVRRGVGHFRAAVGAGSRPG